MKWVNLPAIVVLSFLWAVATTVKMFRWYWREHQADEVSVPFWRWKNWPAYRHELVSAIKPSN